MMKSTAKSTANSSAKSGFLCPNEGFEALPNARPVRIAGSAKTQIKYTFSRNFEPRPAIAGSNRPWKRRDLGEYVAIAYLKVRKLEAIMELCSLKKVVISLKSMDFGGVMGNLEKCPDTKS